ncbi:MAG: methyltransferase domain-containing protein, partial [Verrucomicrobia bacterium]|nr:methyltransferase domain-containing protein [Verrucomicrobiota bacterium]
MTKNWDSSEHWYSSCVGEKGHYYHQTVVLPNVLRLLGTFSSLLDLGCGQGVLRRHLPSGIKYVGIDPSKALIAQAKKLSAGGAFVVGDASEELPIEESDFDRTVFILSLQNIEKGKAAIEQSAKKLRR